MRTPVRGTGVVTVLVTSALLLTACGDDDRAPADVTDIRWQVTAVGDAGFAAAAQARTWLALGANSFTGASGCAQFTGTLDWSGSGDSATVTFSDITTRTDGSCIPGDEFNAGQITDLLNDGPLRWTYNDANTLRHLRLWVDGDPSNGISFAG